jgi:uncharacterized iron-regulated membrane protein
MSQRSKKKQHLHRWHRSLGLFAGLFTLWITLSGITLNHTTELKLDQRHLPNWLQTGISTQTPPMSTYKTGDHWIIQINDRLYLNTQEIMRNSTQLIGAITLQQMQIAATQNALLLFDSSGQLIEQIDWSLILPGLPVSLGKTAEERLAIQTDKGWYLADEALFSWQLATEQSFNSIQPEQPPESISEQLMETYRGKSINYEQLLLNLHTGRILGKYGVYLVDLVALILAVLAVSGFTVWLKRRRL